MVNVETTAQTAGKNNSVNESNSLDHEMPQLQIGKFLIKSGEKNNLSKSECGLYSVKFIVGGREAPEGTHPWIVAVNYLNGFWGGAAIINEWWVVTAAHLFKPTGTNSKDFSISVGNVDRTKGKVYKVEKVIAHKEYNRKGFKELDIAVMKIKGPIVFNTNAQPICLPSKSFESPRGTALIAAGWGLLTYYGWGTPTLLQQVVLNVIPIEKCAEIYDRIGYKNFKNQICTLNSGQDACSADSGGPLVDLINGRGYLVGIVSYGVTCADQYPGVFTKVSYFINWIQSQMESG